MSSNSGSSPSLAVAAAVNNDEVLKANLAASPLFQDAAIPLIVERGYRSASEAYNHALDHSDAEIVIFAHQDVYLPRGWEAKLLCAVRTLEREDKKWAVLGVVGMGLDGAVVGRSWSSGLQSEIDRRVSDPTPVQSLDELVLVLRRGSGVRFDAGLPGFHLYGTDIVQSALVAGFGAYVFDGPVVHNSVPVLGLDAHYRQAYRTMQEKWRSRLPVCTTVTPVTRWGWAMLRQAARLRWAALRAAKPRRRHERPEALARDLGYDG